MKNFANVNEMAQSLGKTPRTIRSWVKAGILPCYKLPGARFSNGHHKIDRGALLFDADAVFAALQKFAVNAPKPPRRRAGRIGEQAAT
jgi:hypothetical protein